MKNTLVLLLCAVLLPIVAQADLFAPGNVIFADPNYNAGAENGQVVELKINGDSAEIVNVVRWNLDNATRRRPLGIDVDPNGTVWVGLTAAFGDTQEFPEGIAEILRIDPDGTQTFVTADIIKGTYLAALGPNEVYISSNAADASTPFRYVIENGEITDRAEFQKSGDGEALRLPDGRLLQGDSGAPGIHIFDDAGGPPIGMFYNGDKTVRSLTYNDQIGSVIASLHDQVTLQRISLDGELEEEHNAGDDGFGNLWGIAQVPGSTNIIMGSHNIDENRNRFALYNALDLAAGPRIITIDSGFVENDLPADYTFRSLFNMAVIPGGEIPSGLDIWELF
ncbi:MAG: hypothetical protein JXR73_18465 [Candidatus Omnitrophica bacterium]|nr:hypothetical protein [Candidatus Omnitrophota bacterium]